MDWCINDVPSLMDAADKHVGHELCKEDRTTGRRNVDTGGRISLMDVDESIIGKNAVYKIGYGYLDGKTVKVVGLRDFSHDRRNIYICGRNGLPDTVFTGNSMVLPVSKCDDDFIHNNMYRLVIFKAGMSDAVAGRFSGCRFIIVNCEEV